VGTSNDRGVRLSRRRASDVGGYWVVSPNYFDALSIPIRQGRSFVLRDTGQAAPVAIINEAMAQTFGGVSLLPIAVA